MTATFNCIVDRVADTQYPCFAPNPTDPGNTVDSGLKVQVLTLEVVPDNLRGGKGHADLWLFDYLQIGRFKPGQRVQVDITVEDS
jgi:hypothetical protein